MQTGRVPPPFFMRNHGPEHLAKALIGGIDDIKHWYNLRKFSCGLKQN
jgi:hypothetical protein